MFLWRVRHRRIVPIWIPDMQRFEVFSGLAVPLDSANVDTDQIIPKQFLRSVRRTGFGAFLFDEWRYLDRGELGMDCATRRQNPDFVLNNPKWRGAQILLARDNFGCGSSREHAVWALAEYGFRAVIASSFSPIFFGNAVQNGLLAAAVDKADMDALFANAYCDNPAKITMDLQKQTATCNGKDYPFAINAEDKRRLLQGLDAIGETLNRADDIRAYEKWRRELEPWVFDIPAEK